MRHTQPSSNFCTTNTTIGLEGDPVVESEIKELGDVRCLTGNDLERCSSLGIVRTRDRNISSFTDSPQGKVPKAPHDPFRQHKAVKARLHFPNSGLRWALIWSPRFRYVIVDVCFSDYPHEKGILARWIKSFRVCPTVGPSSLIMS